MKKSKLFMAATILYVVAAFIITGACDDHPILAILVILSLWAAERYYKLSKECLKSEIMTDDIMDLIIRPDLDDIILAGYEGTGND